jgi:hypothetical protein
VPTEKMMTPLSVLYPIRAKISPDFNPGLQRLEMLLVEEASGCLASVPFVQPKLVPFFSRQKKMLLSSLLD